MVTGWSRYVVGKMIKRLKAAFLTDSWKRKAFYLYHDYPSEISINGDSVTLRLFDLTFRRDTLEFVLDSYNLIRALHLGRTAKIFIENNDLFVEIDGIRIQATTAEEIFIINEIFVVKTYAFDCFEPCIVVDVGMNVGIASLFFASLKNVEKVIGFEPFAQTIAQARLNIGRNPECQRKIELHNVGWGNGDHILEVKYDYSVKGQVGIHGTSFVKSALSNVENQSIEIRDASVIVRGILKLHNERSIIMKLDCEGSEYAIMQNLFANNLLTSFKLILIEWHQQGPDLLLALLRQSGFVSFYQQTSLNVGMIYAAR